MSEQPDPLVSVLVLDTATGATASEDRFTRYWWIYGNGECDCNRKLLFDPGALQARSVCLGKKRYLVLAVDGGPPAPEYNAGYPEWMRMEFLPEGSR